MSNLNSKSSFSIENILCHNLTKPNGYSSMAGLYTDYSSVPFSNHLQTYPLSHFTNSIDFAPARYYFPQTNPQTLPYIDPFTSTFQKATVNNFMPFYSQPFGGYIFPGCIFKRKGGQVRFSPQQSQNLEQQFNSHKYLSPADRKKLAIQLKLSDRQVKTWFQNRRAKWRRVKSAIGSASTNDTLFEINSMDTEIDPVTPKTVYCVSSTDEKHQQNQCVQRVDSTTKPFCPSTPNS